MATVSASRYSKRRRRRRAAFSPSRVATAVTLGAWFLMSSGHVSAAKRSTAEPLVHLDTATLNSNLRHWKTDYAVMFYAPWCNICREHFSPMWERVALQLVKEDPKGKKKLVIAKYDCEQDVNVEYFPTFVFFGSGTFHDHDPVTGLVLGPAPTELPSTAMFPLDAMMYPEVLAKWVKTMHAISKSNRLFERWNPFSRKVKASPDEGLLTEIEELERENYRLQEALLGDTNTGEANHAHGYGDVYNELLQVRYAAEFQPVMMCAIDMANEYCASEGVMGTDPWCTTLAFCAAQEFAAQECWPSTCPFLAKGCELTSYCLAPELIEHYAELFHEAMELEEAEAAATTATETGRSETEAPALAAGGASVYNDEGTRVPDDGMVMGALDMGGHEAVQRSGEGETASLPPFLGRRAAGSQGGLDRTTDDRETMGA